ncbi:MAG: AAA family ATPase [Lachnospiraceae bacterium]|nr:AAA family ATPase [Lachnospiraceae bacterium]
METIKNQIYRLALHYCRNEEAASPEEVLYGLAKLSSLSDMALGYLLKDVKVDDPDDVRKCVEELRAELKERDLDAELIKNGMEQILPYVAGQEKGSAFQKAADTYDEKTPVKKIVSDVVSAIDAEELKVFKVGMELKNVSEYGRTLQDQTETKREAAPKAQKEQHDTAQAERKNRKAESTEKKEKENGKPEAEKPPEIEIFSEKLNAYLKELENIVPKFVEAGNEEILWKQSIIVAIDDGYGFSSFLKRMEQIYKSYDLIGGKGEKSIIKEIRAVSGEPEHVGDTMIPGIEKLVMDYGDITDKKKAYSILAIDISEVSGEVNSPDFKGLLRCIEQNCDSVLVVFRLPYMEPHVVAQIEASISDVLATDKITVPPVSMACMLDYLHKRAKTDGFAFEEGCDEYLEQGIISEKNDGRFYGFKTLNKLLDSVFYKKLKDGTDGKNLNKRISAEDLKKYINVEEQVLDHEQTAKNMVGVEEILKQIDKAINQVKIQQQLQKKGSSAERPAIHMMFRGNPGTGKTTIARIVAAKMKQAGILKKGHCFEIKGRDLCGRYVGETTPITTKYCRDAYGSVLFIDEAYELYRGEESSVRDYGREALAALVAEMENHRDDMCVIFAGYTDEMNVMLGGNPGLKSRIPIYIDFPNYTREQLEEIFFKMMDGKFEYEKGLKECVHTFFTSLSDDVLESKEFSNARFVRNLFESVWGEAAMRYDLSDDDKLIIRESDFKAAAERADIASMVPKKTRPIGFTV